MAVGVIGTIAFNFSAGTSSTISGQDNEAGNQSIISTQVPVPANSTNFPITLALNSSLVQMVYLQASTTCTLTTNNTNTADVQTFTVTGTPSGGSIPIAWNSNGTVVATSVAYNSNAATLQTALQLLTGAGNTTCSGGPFPGSAINATFAGSLNTGKQPVFVVSNAAFTGGSSPNVTVTHAVTGAPTDTINLVAGIPRIWGASQGYGSSPFSGNVNAAFLTCNSSTLLNIGIVTL